jgi:microcin C transport system ATP-binding protein
MSINLLGDGVRDALDPRLKSGALSRPMAATLVDRREPVPEAEGKGVLALQDLRTEFRVRDRTYKAVGGVSLSVAPGECLGIIGESGSGKSVTALSITGLVASPPGVFTGGAVRFNGADLIGAKYGRLRQIRGDRIAYIFQDPLATLHPLIKVGDQLVEAIRVHHAVSDREARTRALDLLRSVRIPNVESRIDSYPHEMSGGMRQRVGIAMALANDPDVIIADEPTTALDVTVQAQILALLKDLQRRMGMAMLFITHDLGIVRKLADRLCVMKEGKIVERGSVEQVFTAPQHPYTRALLAAEPRPDPAPVRPDAPVIVETKDLKVWFPIKRGVLRKVVGHIKAVDGVDIAIRQGETLGIVGESGSGKTTLGLAILRLISSQGTIAFLGKDIMGLKFRQMRPFRHHMQIVFQDPYGSLSPRMSVSDVIEEGLWVHHPKLSAHAREERVVRALRDVGLDPETRFRYPHEFSGGQRQRIAVARAIVLEPTFVVLDEPTSALDMLIQAQIVDLLRDLQKRHNLTYLFISHDLRVVAALASNLVVMRHGKVVEGGPAAELFERPKSDYTRALFAAAFNLETAPVGVVAE